MSKVKNKSKKQILKSSSPFKNYWDKSNTILFLIGIAVVLIGFVLMAQDPWNNSLSLSVSPIVLLVAYLIIFPLSILYKTKKVKSAENVSSED